MCVKLVYDSTQQWMVWGKGVNNVVYVHRQNRKYDTQPKLTKGHDSSSSRGETEWGLKRNRMKQQHQQQQWKQLWQPCSAVRFGQVQSSQSMPPASNNHLPQLQCASCNAPIVVSSLWLWSSLSACGCCCIACLPASLPMFILRSRWHCP